MVPRLDMRAVPPFALRPQIRLYGGGITLLFLLLVVGFLADWGTAGVIAPGGAFDAYVIGVLTFTTVKWRRAWKASDGYLCPWCGYNLHDSREVDACPECGRDPASWKDRWAFLRQ